MIEYLATHPLGVLFSRENTQIAISALDVALSAPYLQCKLKWKVPGGRDRARSEGR